MTLEINAHGICDLYSIVRVGNHSLEIVSGVSDTGQYPSRRHLIGFEVSLIVSVFNDVGCVTVVLDRTLPASTYPALIGYIDTSFIGLIPDEFIVPSFHLDILIRKSDEVRFELRIVITDTAGKQNQSGSSGRGKELPSLGVREINGIEE